MKFVEYDPNTYAVVCYGESSEESIDASIDAGRPIIAIDQLPDDFGLHLYDVDPTTKTMVRAAEDRPDPFAPLPPIDPRSQIMPISDRQFYQKAAIDGYISREDAIKAVQSGFVPSIFQEVIDGMVNPEEKFNATMLFAGATVYYRQHHYTELFGVALGLTSEEVDTFWIDAAKL